MAIISAIGFMAILSIVTGIAERIAGNRERRMDKAAVGIIRAREYRYN